jgi:hypothetical protein
VVAPRKGFGGAPGRPAVTPGPQQTFHVRAEFRAPIEYVFAWCTDYRPDDARREREEYQRRIVSRSKRRVVYEDLGDAEPGGWWWSRFDVTLRPPDRWTAESVGSHRTLRLDYRLTRLGADRTRLDLRWKRRSTGLGPVRVSRSEMEKGTTVAWRNFAKALEKDYRSMSRPRR